MIALLVALSCAPVEPVSDAPGFLATVTDEWWTLRDAGYEFYLDAGGSLWYNTYGSPHEDHTDDDYAGEWSYEGSGCFTIDGWSVKAKVLTDTDCFRLTVGGIRTDTACPYVGPWARE